MHSLAPGAVQGADPALVLAPYVERFAKGRRVAVFGDATTGLAEALASRGARLVHAYDPDAARVAHALALAPPRNLSFAHLASGELGVRDGAFDLTVVPDLSLFPDTKAFLARVRQATATGGMVLIATPAASEAGEPALGYYDFYDAVALQFADVKMVGQVPFSGFALVDFGVEGDAEVAVDTSLVPSGDPTAYIAIASDQPFEVDGYSIVQLSCLTSGPPKDDTELRASVAEALAGRGVALAEVDAGRETRRVLEARLEAEHRKVTELTRALAEAETLPRGLEAKLAEETRRTSALAQQLAKAEDAKRVLAGAHDAELAKAEDAKRVLAAAHETALARARDAAREKPRDAADRPETTRALADAKAELARVTGREAELGRKLKDLEARLVAASAPRVDPAVAELSRKLKDAETKLAAASSAPRVDPAALDGALARAASLEERLRRANQVPAADTEHAVEVGKLEEMLRERAHEIASLRHEVERRGALVRELLETLEQGPAASNRLTPGLEHLASRPARCAVLLRREHPGLRPPFHS